MIGVDAMLVYEGTRYYDLHGEYLATILEPAMATDTDLEIQAIESGLRIVTREATLLSCLGGGNKVFRVERVNGAYPHDAGRQMEKLARAYVMELATERKAAYDRAERARLVKP